MNHPFLASQLDPTICAKCKRDEHTHGKAVQCEACNNNLTPVELVGNILMCKSCEIKEVGLDNYLASIRANNARSHEILDLSKRQDQTIQIKTDFFNAETVAISDLAASLQHDDSIPTDKKNYTLAESVVARIQHYQSTIFDKKKELEELENKQRANQVYLNNLALKLLASEREALKLNSPNYQVVEAKPQKIKEKAIVIHREDKNIHAFAKMMNLPFEHAKRLYNQRLDQAKNSAKIAKDKEKLIAVEDESVKDKENETGHSEQTNPNPSN